VGSAQSFGAQDGASPCGTCPHGSASSLRTQESGLSATDPDPSPGADLEPDGRHALGPIAMKLSILMPTYNEERTIVRAIGEVLSAGYPCDVELIVVDDGSTDRTPILLEQMDDPRVRVHRHPVNRGKGAAVLSAASLATGTHVLLFDADLEYSADDIALMLAPVQRGRCGVVYGARLRGCNTVYRSYLYTTANRLLTSAANVLFNACVTDLHTCLKLLPLPLLRSMRLTETRFGLDTELTAVLLRLGVRPFEVAISYRGRTRSQGKKITLRDAVISAWILLRVRLLLRRQLTHLASGPSADVHAAVGTDDPEAEWMWHLTSFTVNHGEDEVSASAMG
jgi:dolichol-phosphate hexosyltransferase